MYICYEFSCNLMNFHVKRHEKLITSNHVFGFRVELLNPDCKICISHRVPLDYGTIPCIAYTKFRLRAKPTYCLPCDRREKMSHKKVLTNFISIPSFFF